MKQRLLMRICGNRHPESKRACSARRLSRVTSQHLFCVFFIHKRLISRAQVESECAQPNTQQLQTPGSASSISVTKKKAICGAHPCFSSLTSTLVFRSLFHKRVLRVTGPHAAFHNLHQMGRQMVKPETSSLKSFCTQPNNQTLNKKSRKETSPCLVSK